MLRKFSVAVVAIFMATLNSCPLFAQEWRTCGVNDVRCLESTVENVCSLSAQSSRDCVGLLEELQNTLASTPTPELASALGVANLLLSFRAEQEGNQEARIEYLDAAELANEQAVRLDPSFTSGYMGLAGIALYEERLDDRIEFLRQAVATSESRMHLTLLADALTNEVGTFEAELEAVQLIEAAYERKESGDAKWNLALNAWVRNSILVERWPDRTDASLPLVFAERVERDIKLDDLTISLRAPELHAHDVASSLKQVCFEPIVGIFGIEHCRRGIDAALSVASTSSNYSLCEQLVRAAAHGIQRSTNWRLGFELEEWRTVYEGWIDLALAVDVEANDFHADLFLMRADVAIDSDSRISALESGLAISPDRVDLQVRLGTAYMDAGMWNEAQTQLSAARQYAGEKMDQGLIDRHLRTVNEQLAQE